MRLTNHFLIPTAQMQDPRFANRLIYICRHDKKMAWGLIVNDPNPALSVGRVLMGLDIDKPALMHTPTMNGGVAFQNVGVILHTGLPRFQESFALGENICLTTSRDILLHLDSDWDNNTAFQFLLLMGVCIWGENQLEQEIAQKSWLSCPATSETLFFADHSQKLSQAYKNLGLNPALFDPSIGQA